MVKDGVTISKDSGSGNYTVTISASANEGIDAVIPITISTDDGKHKNISIIREGRREVFMASDGDFLLKDGDTFNVIKQGYEQ